MKDYSKGGSPTEKRLIKPLPVPVVPAQAVPQMMNFAAYAIIQQRRAEERMQNKPEAN